MDHNNDKGEQLLFTASAFIANQLTATVLEMMEGHKWRNDRCPEFQTLNKFAGSLKGKDRIRLKLKPQALVDLFNKAGYSYYTTGVNYKGEVVAHLTPYSAPNRKLLMQTVQRSCASIINKKLRHYLQGQRQRIVGVQYYGDTYTPEAHILCEPIPNEATTAPVNVPIHNHKKQLHDQVNEEDNNSPFSTSAYSQANQRRLIQIQQQAVNNDGRDDDNDNEPEPAKPTPPSPNINDSSLQQSIHQQQQAIEDDEDEKKKRDRRLQKQRTKQRLNHQQTEQEKQDETARIIRERCLAAEAKRNAELKHPKRNNGSGHSANGRSHQPTPDNGPSF